MGLFDNFLQQLGTGDQIKDYKHASRLFVDNNYALSPKYGWLFHVYFDLNPALTSIMRDSTKTVEAGMLVKSADLPKFSVDNKVYNNYNRPSIIQTKLKYSPISISFHDDQSDVVRNFWYDYYNYYYRDSDIGYMGSSGDINPKYYEKSKYVGGDRSQFNKFGYSPRTAGSDNQFIKAIRIYSLHQKKFTEYTLVNPVIVDFSHGSHDVSTNSPMDHLMTISYETILYESGYVTPSTVRGFADLHYDKSPSPLSPAGGGTQSIFGPGGIVSAVDGFIRNPASGAFGLFRTLQKNKNVNLKGLASTELTSIGLSILSGQNPGNRIYIPVTGAVSTNNPSVSPPILGAPSGGSASSNGSSVVAAVTAFAIANEAKKSSNANTTSSSLNTVTSLSADGVAGESAPFSFNFFATALTKYQADKKAKVDAEKLAQAEKEKAGAANLGNNGLAAAPTGVSSAALLMSGVPVFQSGTSTVAAGTQNGSVLQQTPNSYYVVAASSGVAASESAKFTNNGNPLPVTPSSTNGGGYGQFTATSPAPSSTNGVG